MNAKESLDRVTSREIRPDDEGSFSAIDGVAKRPMEFLDLGLRFYDPREPRWSLSVSGSDGTPAATTVWVERIKNSRWANATS